MTDTLDIQAIRAMAEAATEGPWEYNGVLLCGEVGAGRPIVHAAERIAIIERSINARFIARGKHA